MIVNHKYDIIDHQYVYFRQYCIFAIKNVFFAIRNTVLFKEWHSLFIINLNFFAEEKDRYLDCHTVKPILSGHSKIDKTRVLKTNDSLMKVESIAECSLGAFCNTFDLHYAIIGLEN